jgi:arginine/lysine/ornithine decarboxylase
MAGLDYCVSLLSERGTELFERYVRRLHGFSQKMKSLSHLKILFKGRDEGGEHPHIYAFDPGKIVISAANTDITGERLKEILLEKYKIQVEMAAGSYVLAMTSIADTDEGFDRLASALIEIDSELSDRPTAEPVYCPVLERVMPIYRAQSEKAELVSFSQSAGRISGEYVYSYPPGIPLIVPGELISEDFIDAIEMMQKQSVSLTSTYGGMPTKIRVIEPA